MEVVGWLDRTLPAEHPYATVQAMPSGLSSPEVWLLGSSDYSGALAAYLGLRFAFAHFINAHGGDAVTRAYRNDFRPSLRESAPYAMVCVFALCAETEADAQRLAASIDHRRLLMAVGREAPIATVEEAQAYPYTDRERSIIERERSRAVIGTPDKVKARLMEIADAYSADELMLVTITGDYASRMKSYELLAAEFGLHSAGRTAA
jgi:luciferase family oxidoreductase group 1